MKKKAVLRQAQDKRFWGMLAVTVALTLTACAPSGPRMPRNLRPIASPSDVIAAELAFARMAQEKGQWTAFAEYATDDAVMFVPEPVNARQWLRKQKNPAQAVAWQPHQVWSSCDGSLAVTKGAWQRPDGSVGYFTTIWQRQRDGTYKWVLDQGDVLAQPLVAPEFVQADVADCGKPGELVVQADGPDQHREGEAKDDTLRWFANAYPDNSRTLAVYISKNGGMEKIIDLRVDGEAQ